MPYTISDPNFFLARLTSNGNLDISFDTDGTVTTDIDGGEDDYLHDIVLTDDGKIIAAGETNNEPILIQYNSDGSLDTSFGSSGVALQSIHDGSENLEDLEAVNVDSDGYIYALGEYHLPDTSCVNNSGVALYKLESNGSLVSSFGSSGIEILETSYHFSSTNDNFFALQGFSIYSGFQTFNYDADCSGSYTERSILSMHQKNNGALKTTFSSDGILTEQISHYNPAGFLTTNQNNMIVYGNATDFSYIYLRKIKSDGSTDTSFGPVGTGYAISYFSSNATSYFMVQKAVQFTGSPSIYLIGLDKSSNLSLWGYLFITKYN